MIVTTIMITTMVIADDGDNEDDDDRRTSERLENELKSFSQLGCCCSCHNPVLSLPLAMCVLNLNLYFRKCVCI